MLHVFLFSTYFFFNNQLVKNYYERVFHVPDGEVQKESIGACDPKLAEALNDFLKNL